MTSYALDPSQATNTEQATALSTSVPQQFTLSDAYRYADLITKQYSKSFYMASALLPEPKKRSIRALYGFCRLTDNLVDDPDAMLCGEELIDLAWWRAHVNRPYGEHENPALAAWSHAREQYGVPTRYGDELIEGCEMDLSTTRYATFDELRYYCYCVASTVGLMAMYIIGFTPGVSAEEATPYAIDLGVALQLTNILRDVGEDAQRGRIYIPQEDMERFNVPESDILAGNRTPNVIALLNFEIERTRKLYADSWKGIRMLYPSGRVAVAAAAHLYRGILDKIEENQYDVFTKRAHLTTSDKLTRLPGIWYRTRIKGE
jgi:15-cis-phytoene synthase